MNFRTVPTFHLLDGESMAYVNREDSDQITFEFDCASLNIEQAKALRDWLNTALPDNTNSEPTK